MGAQTTALGQSGDFLHVGQGQRLSAHRVFDHDEPGTGEMRIVRFDHRLDVVQSKRAVRLLLQRLGLDRSQNGHAACLPAIGVPLLTDNGLVTAAAMRHHGDQVALGAAGRKQASFEAEHRGGGVLQEIYRRIFSHYVVTERRFDHGLLHGRGGLGDGVAAKVAHGLFLAIGQK